MLLSQLPPPPFFCLQKETVDVSFGLFAFLTESLGETRDGTRSLNSARGKLLNFLHVSQSLTVLLDGFEGVPATEVCLGVVGVQVDGLSAVGDDTSVILDLAQALGAVAVALGHDQAVALVVFGEPDAAGKVLHGLLVVGARVGGDAVL